MLRNQVLSVDSVRAFYQDYALWARDGIISTDEVLEFGLYLGLQPAAGNAVTDTALPVPPHTLGDTL